MVPGAQIKIGISSCLLGENVRYDGHNKYDRYIVEVLGQYVDFVPVCPETGIGLGVPRPAVRLHGRKGRVYALGIDDPDIDITDALTGYGKKQADMLSAISGYIFKSRSPSCGITDTPISTPAGKTYGTGLYARQIIEAIPQLPVTDEVSLKHENHGDHFLEQALAFNRWQQFMNKPFSVARLGIFHSLHAPELERHHADLAKGLSEILLSLEDPVSKDTAQDYLERFMAVLQAPVITETHAEELFERHTQLSAALDHHAD